VTKFQALVYCENKKKSIAAFVAYHLLCFALYLGLLDWCSLRPLGLLAGAALLVFVHQQWVHHIWPEIRVPINPRDKYTDDDWIHIYSDPRVLSATEVGDKLEKMWESVRQKTTAVFKFRREHPAVVCLLASLFWIFLLFLGQLLTDLQILYVIATAFLLAPTATRYLLPCLRARGGCFLARFEERCSSLSLWAQQKIPSALTEEGSDTEFLPEDCTSEALEALSSPMAERSKLQHSFSHSGDSEDDDTGSLSGSSSLGSVDHLLDRGNHSSHDTQADRSHSHDSDELPSVCNSSEDDEDFSQGLDFEGRSRRSYRDDSDGHRSGRDEEGRSHRSDNEARSHRDGRKKRSHRSDREDRKEVDNAASGMQMLTTLMSMGQNSLGNQEGLLTSIGKNILFSGLMNRANEPARVTSHDSDDESI